MNNTTSVTSLLTASSSAGATLDEETSQNDDMSQDSAAAKDTIKDAVTGLKTADVVLDKEKEVERIGDYPIKDINLSLVRLFMSKNVIEPMGQSKRVPLLALIAKARLELGRVTDKLLPKNTSTKPRFITVDDTLLRAVHSYFDQSIRVDVQYLDNSLARNELDSKLTKSAYWSILKPTR